MGWKQIAVGALITTIVTIFAGIVVWLITKEPKTETPKESLIFSVHKIGALSDSRTRTPGKTKTTFLVISLANRGSKTANNVRGSIEFDGKYQIEEKQLEANSGIVTDANIIQSDNNVSLSSPTLTSAEIVTVSLLVRGPDEASPIVGFRSNESIAVEGAVLNLAANEPTNFFTSRFLYSAALIMAQGAILLFCTSRAKRLFDAIGSANDAAFVMLHRGLLEEAREILASKMNRRGASVFELTNFGLILGLEGDHDKAERYQQAAEWRAWSKRTKSVIAFNRAIIGVARKDFVYARDELEKALRMDNSLIRRYATYSIFIQEARQIEKPIDDLSKLSI